MEIRDVLEWEAIVDDTFLLIAFTTFVVKNTPAWLASLSSTVLGKSQEFAVDKGDELVADKGKQLVRRLFHLEEKEQLRHLQQALKNATERGLATFQTDHERDLYQDVVCTLSQKGTQGEELRHEVMQIFTLADNPDLTKLNDIYNRRQRLHDANHRDIDAAPCLNSFFSALVSELYADPYFRPQLSDILQLRTSVSMPQSLLHVISMLTDIKALLDNDYSAEDFARDVAVYTAHVERTLHHLEIRGAVSRDQSTDPEISSIFVPLRIALNDQNGGSDQAPDDVVAVLEQSPCLVLLGGPGSGKSTVTKHLAWSHAAVNQSSATLALTPLLSGNPLPLRIELRRLNEERKRANYDFLSFATEVLLKREGITINPQMFKELLTRRCLLLLFDGLDEVATLNERLELANEVKNFALSYPGNRILVTSRPVGYDLSRISHPLFAHATVQNFNDEQMKQFLHNWYTAVLQLSPLSQPQQQERDLLLTTLKENPRLHKLAENPLLLTVITSIYRNQRLPDRRVLVYDNCADLLLERWAKLRGTDKRWQDMRMVKEDQYASVAYLGFVLHEHSQEQQSVTGAKIEEAAVDVSSRFLYHCVEEFLKKRELIVGTVEQRAEAKRFITLLQEEAGLIVERGTDENSEPLYGFIHRTFQEYFAAADVYERYQQEEDSTVISDFLRECLHDPHWSEVILLLLGKLKSKPVTKQLRDILEGKTQSLRSCYTDILQQDLFFVCDCLLEEIKVENSLIELVVSRLCDVVQNGRFPTQQRMALEYLAKLLNTSQSTRRGKQELVEFATKNFTLDMATRLYALQVFYLYASALSEERSQVLTIWAGLSVEQTKVTVEPLHWMIPARSSELKRMVLKKLLERTDLSVEQALEAAISLCYDCFGDAVAKQLPITVLAQLVDRADFSVEQMQEIAKHLVAASAQESEYGELEIHQLATRILMKLLGRKDLSLEQEWEMAASLYHCSRELDVRQQAVAILKNLFDTIGLAREQVLKMALSFYNQISFFKESELEQSITKALMGLLRGANLPVEQTKETAAALYSNSPVGSEAEQLASEVLMQLAERIDLSVEQVRNMAAFLHVRNSKRSDGQRLETMMLRRLLERADLSAEEVLETAKSLHNYSPKESDDQQRAVASLMKLLERTDLSVEQVMETARSLYNHSPKGSDDQQRAVASLMKLLERTDLSVEQVQETAEFLYVKNPAGSEACQLAITNLMRLLERTDLSVKQMWQVTGIFYDYVPKWADNQLIVASLKKFLARTDLSVEQVRKTANFFYDCSSIGELDARQPAVTSLVGLLERTDLSLKQMWKTAESLYLRSSKRSNARRLATRILKQLMERMDLPVKMVWKTAESLYNQRFNGSEEQLFAVSMMLPILSHIDKSEIESDVYGMLRSMVPQFHKLPS
jgi:hypothetical protein